MKKNMKKVRKTVAVFTLTSILGVSGVLTGCSSGSKSDDKDSEVQEIIIGSGNAYNPYCYLDEKGNAAGYEYDVLKEIDALLPQYEFKYEPMSFDQILLSLDSGKIDVAAHQYEYTDERAEKYLFGKESYTSYITYLTVKKEDKATSIDDLAGEKIRTGGATSASTQILKNYNEEHPDKAVEIVSSDGATDEESAAAIQSGAARAIVLKKSDMAKLNKNYSEDGNDWLKEIGEPVNNSKTYYLYKQGNTELQEAMDGALKKLKENGKLSELAVKWVGYDVTEEE